MPRISPPPTTFAGLLLLISLAACSGGASTVYVPATAPSAAAPATTGPSATAAADVGPLNLPPMHFDSTDMTIKGKPFKIEIADNDARQERGLMNRTTMPPDHGMLFVFDKADKYSFWMKNTLIPLDIIFLDSTGKVLLVDRRAPLDEKGHGPTTPALYVIELNVGIADAIGLKPGDSVALPAKYLKTP